MSDSPEVRDVLLAAAELLEPEGAWVQGSGTRVLPDGRVALCAVVAIARLSPTTASRRDAWQAVAEHVGCAVLSAWNDNPQRTQAEVVATLRAVAGSR